MSISNISESLEQLIAAVKDAEANEKNIFLDGAEISDERDLKDIRVYARILANSIADAKKRSVKDYTAAEVVPGKWRIEKK